MAHNYDFFRGYTEEQRSRMSEEDMLDALYRPHDAEAMKRGKIPITHIGQTYDWHPELVTKNEDQIEDFYRIPWKEGTPTFWWKDVLDTGDRSICWRGSAIQWKNGLMKFHPDNQTYMEDKLASRLPALGLNYYQLDRLQRDAQDDSKSPLEKKAMFLFIRNTMLGQLISCDGASTLHDLVRILREQLASGKPAPIPKWFDCGDGVFLGTGYHACENRGCYHTDTPTRQLSRCSKCKLAVYCSKECLMADRDARHKICCKEARELNALYARRHSS